MDNNWIPVFVAFVVAYLTLQNFFRQKWWERKEEIYTETIAKLQEILNLLLRCERDISRFGRLDFDDIDLNNNLISLDQLIREFELYVYKLFPYMMRPSLEKVIAISLNVKENFAPINEYIGAGDEPIDFSEEQTRRDILDSLEKTNALLAYEIQYFSFFMKADLCINVRFFVSKYLLIIKSLIKYMMQKTEE